MQAFVVPWLGCVRRRAHTVHAECRKEGQSRKTGESATGHTMVVLGARPEGPQNDHHAHAIAFSRLERARKPKGKRSTIWSIPHLYPRRTRLNRSTPTCRRSVGRRCSVLPMRPTWGGAS